MSFQTFTRLFLTSSRDSTGKGRPWCAFHGRRRTSHLRLITSENYFSFINAYMKENLIVFFFFFTGKT